MKNICFTDAILSYTSLIKKKKIIYKTLTSILQGFKQKKAETRGNWTSHFTYAASSQ